MSHPLCFTNINFASLFCFFSPVVLMVFVAFNVDIPAFMARKIYLRHGLGVGAFRRAYGGSKEEWMSPPHFCKSSGAIARHILQQLQNVNIIDIDSKG